MPKLYERADSPFWYADITVNGASKRISTGVPRGRSHRRRAEEVAAEREKELSADCARNLSPSLRDVAGAFIEASDLKASTLEHYAKMLRRVLQDAPVLADIDLKWIKAYVARRRLEPLRGGRSKGGSPDIQIRRELTALSSVMEWAIDQEYEGAPETNPCRLYRKKGLKNAVKKPRWLKPPQVQRLFDTAPGEFWKPFILVVLDTGLRHEEVLGLQWSDVDFKRGVIEVTWEREKGARGRFVPMSDTVIRTLQRLPRHQNCPYVFFNRRTGKRYKSIQSTWNRLRIRAGEPSARIHDLRHTFSSWTRQMGMDRETRKDIVGHVDDITHGGYAHASIETLVESVRKHSPSTLLSHGEE